MTARGAARPRARRSVGRRLLRIAALVVILGVVWLFWLWPPPLWYRGHWPRETAFMAMRADQCDDLRARAADPKPAEKAARGSKTAPAKRLGLRLASCPAERRYRPVALDSIARPMLEAVLIGEDNHFWEHGGIDWSAIRDAIGYRREDFTWGNAKDRAELRRALGRAWERRDRIRGASTITQQLAKNLYLSPSRNPLRKVKEALTAYRLEWILGKRRILELYLNTAEMGPGIWGVEAASRAYFGRSARNLTRDQAAALAGLLPFPLSSNPGYRPGRMRWRQNLILRRMQGEQIVIPPDEEEEKARGGPEGSEGTEGQGGVGGNGQTQDSGPTPIAPDTEPRP